MTCIAYKDGIMAADKMAVASGCRHSSVTKIRRIGASLVGFCGAYRAGLAMMDWVARGGHAEDFPRLPDDDADSCLIVVDQDGKILMYEASPIALPFEDEYKAIGSGRDYALAAMYLGHSAEEAVNVACHFDIGCGNGVDVLKLWP